MNRRAVPLLELRRVSAFSEGVFWNGSKRNREASEIAVTIKLRNCKHVLTDGGLGEATQ